MRLKTFLSPRLEEVSPGESYAEEFDAAWARTERLGLDARPFRVIVRKDCVDVRKVMPLVLDYFSQHTPAELIGVLGRLLAQSGETAIDGMQQTLKESSRWRKRQTLHWRRRVLAVGIALLVGGISLLLLLIGWLSGSRKESPPKPLRSERSSVPPSADDFVQF